MFVVFIFLFFSKPKSLCCHVLKLLYMVQLHEISRHKLMQMVLLTFSLWYFHILYKLLLQHGLFFWSLLIDWLLSCTNALLELCHFSVIVCVSPVELVSVSLFLCQTIFLLADKVIYLSASH